MKLYLEKMLQNIGQVFAGALMCFMLVLGMFVPITQGQANMSDYYFARSSELHPNMEFAKSSSSKKALSKTIALRLEDASLLYALEKITAHTDLTLSYGVSSVSLKKKVTLTNDRITVNEALWTVLEGTGLHFAISSNRHLVIYSLMDPPSKAEQVQAGTISGKVTVEDSGEPLPGANVFLQGTQ